MLDGRFPGELERALALEIRGWNVSMKGKSGRVLSDRFGGRFDFDHEFLSREAADDHQGRGRQMPNIRQPGIAGFHVACHMLARCHIGVDPQNARARRAGLFKDEIDICEDELCLSFGSVRHSAIGRKGKLARGQHKAIRCNPMGITRKGRGHGGWREALDHQTLQLVGQVSHPGCVFH